MSEILITKNTVLVLGAGASAPYGFPVGQDLIQYFVDALKPPQLNKDLADPLRWCGFGDGKMVSFRDTLAKSLPRSIDTFLQNRDEFLKLGKHAIASYLISWEQPLNILWRRTGNPPDSGKNTWYHYLWEQMQDSEQQFEQSPLSVVTFNYDRSLEYFLYGRVQAQFGVSEPRAVELVKTKPIVHVHGDLGKPHFLMNSLNLFKREHDAS